MSETMRQEIKLAGSGGQGIILASVILAEAAVLSGKEAAQSQSYGPEARGGSCKAEVIVSDRPIGFTKVRKPTFLMALTQDAFDKYYPGVTPECVVLADADMEVPERVIKLPILDTARTVVGKIQTANIVAVGCINGLLGLTDVENLRQAVMMHVPAGTEKLNMQALEEGLRLVGKGQETA